MSFEAKLDRREMIRLVSACLGGAALVASSDLLAAMDKPATTASGFFTAADIAFLDEIAETILPETKTPGAKAAKVGAFMAVMVSDCYREPQQAVFRDGMRQIDAATQRLAKLSFLQASPAQRLAVLTMFDAEQKKPTATPSRRSSKRAALPQPHFFRMMKELTLLGYFTSEIGCTQALRYAETPGHFAPCVPYKAGESAWAEHA